MNDGGGNETVIFRPVHQAPGPESLSWSPDGSQIAFQLDEYLNGRTETRINVLNADGSNRRMLGVGREPAWSPDGRSIVYTTGDPSKAQLDARVTVMNADGSAIKELGRGMDADWQPCPAGATCRLAAPPVRCRVPRVIGLLLGRARVRIRRANCSVGRIRRARSKRVGRVISQSPRPDAVKPRGFPVRLVVGRR